MTHVMKLHPFDQCAVNAQYVMAQGADIYQQFNCEWCETKQTMETPNRFFEKGTCQECGKETDIKKNGCNFMASVPLTRRGRSRSGNTNPPAQGR